MPTIKLERNADHISLCDEINPALFAGQDPVYVWKVALDLEAAQVSEWEQSLSPEEVARADRFHLLRDRRRFIVARAALRAVLSGCLHVPAAHLRFSYTPDQKPVLAPPASASAPILGFNVSHSDSFALIAVAPGRDVGVDLERVRTDFDPDALAKRFFSPAESAALSEMPSEERHRDFLTYWVCKEAYLKAQGTGLRRPLDQFTVSWEDHSIRQIGPAGTGEALAPYHLQSFRPHPGYVAAIAIETR